MSINWAHFGNYLYDNRAPIILGVGTLITASVKTAPVPYVATGRIWNSVYYAWAYDGFHQLLNITNTRLNTTPTLTPPDAKEESGIIPKK